MKVPLLILGFLARRGPLHGYRIKKLIAERAAENVRALRREDGADGEENRESAGIVALAFQPIDAFEVAGRYGVFDDGRRGEQDEILDHRYLAGFNVMFWEYLTFSFEYRHSKYEREADSRAAKTGGTLMHRLLIEDDRKIALVVQTGLKEDGFAVDHVNNGEDGLHLLPAGENRQKL